MEVILNSTILSIVAVHRNQQKMHSGVYLHGYLYTAIFLLGGTIKTGCGAL